MPYYLAIDTLLVTCRGEQRRFNRGDDLSEIPAGMLAPLVRLGKATDELPAPPEADAPAEAPAAPVDPVDDGTDLEAPADWQLTPIADLQVASHVKESLADAGLASVADVLAYGELHDGSLISLHGIGGASEKAIQAAIEAIAPQE